MFVYVWWNYSHSHFGLDMVMSAFQSDEVTPMKRLNSATSEAEKCNKMEQLKEKRLTGH